MNLKSYKKLKNLSLILTLLFGLLSVGTLILGVGGAGSLKDLERDLKEIQEMEKKGLIHNPPETFSKEAKQALKVSRNSRILKRDIEEIQASVSHLEFCFFLFLSLFFLSLMGRIYLGRKVKK